MTLRRDHVVGAALLAGAALAFLLGGDLPVGTLGSPGPGMLPYLAIGLIAIFALVLLASAGSSPPAADTTWSELPHSAAIALVAAGAAAAYQHLGFLVTMWMMISALLAFVERVDAWKAILYAAGIAIATRILLATLLKSPLPVGPFGF
jgi:hypothetical protein